MERLQRIAVLLSLIETLEDKGSWCGETHIQKTTYFLEKGMGVPLGYEFILYKHGPYSFDLSDEIMSTLADGYLKVIPKYPYGPSIIPSNNSASLKQKNKSIIDQYKKEIQFTSDQLANKTVVELEMLATALYVTLEYPKEQYNYRAQIIHDIKPHISLDSAASAVDVVDRILEEQKQIV